MDDLGLFFVENGVFWEPNSCKVLIFRSRCVKTMVFCLWLRDCIFCSQNNTRTWSPNHLFGSTAHKQTTPIQLQHLSMVTVFPVRQGSAIVQNTRCGHELRRHPRQLPHPNVEVLHDALRLFLQQTPSIARLQLPPEAPWTFSLLFGLFLPGETRKFVLVPERATPIVVIPQPLPLVQQFPPQRILRFQSLGR